MTHADALNILSRLHEIGNTLLIVVALLGGILGAVIVSGARR